MDLPLNGGELARKSPHGSKTEDQESQGSIQFEGWRDSSFWTVRTKPKLRDMRSISVQVMDSVISIATPITEPLNQHLATESCIQDQCNSGHKLQIRL